MLVYKFDADKGTLTPNEPPSVSVAPAAGPRHFAFHPNGKFAYVINEMNLTITPFTYDADKGVLTPMKPISTVPEGVIARASRRRKSRSIRRASSCTAPIAAITALPNSRSTRRPAS